MSPVKRDMFTCIFLGRRLISHGHLKGSCGTRQVKALFAKDKCVGFLFCVVGLCKKHFETLIKD
jgi:hypothetical protein